MMKKVKEISICMQFPLFLASFTRYKILNMFANVRTHFKENWLKTYAKIPLAEEDLFNLRYIRVYFEIRKNLANTALTE